LRKFRVEGWALRVQSSKLPFQVPAQNFNGTVTLKNPAEEG